MVPFGPFEPSRSIFGETVSTYALNVRPVADGWGSMPALMPYSQALPDTCLGAVYVRDDAGNIAIYAGTQTRLWRLDPATLGWIDVTRTSGGNYGVQDGDRWSFEVFGPYLVAVNINDAPQVINIASGSSFANLAGSPPQAKYVWTAGDFLVLGHLQGHPDRIQWSGLNNIEHWTVGAQLSDYQTFPDGHEVQGGISDRLGAFVIQRDAIRTMQIDVSGGYAFTFQSANPARGAAAAGSVAQIGAGQFAYLSEDGFFMGAEARAIGAERVDRWFLSEELDIEDIALVQASVDPFEKTIWWGYKAQDGARRVLGYDWQLDRWCWTDAAVTCLAAMLTPAITVDAADAYFATVDVANITFDSRFWKGGRPNFAGFDIANRLGFFTGSPMTARVETADIAFASGARSFVRGARLVSDAATLALEVATSAFHGDDRVWKPARSPSPATGSVPLRADGRLHRFRATIAAGTPWTHLHGLDPEVVASGLR